ncbi:unnamed protein product [Ilex paraguariensis]|uniref:Uncharacterized protein n=1 Tax=Ilex paraguariensis TaxID=185542 RepID=A0ABC8UJ55_9AQUA
MQVKSSELQGTYDDDVGAIEVIQLKSSELQGGNDDDVGAMVVMQLKSSELQGANDDDVGAVEVMQVKSSELQRANDDDVGAVEVMQLKSSELQGANDDDVGAVEGANDDDVGAVEGANDDDVGAVEGPSPRTDTNHGFKKCVVEVLKSAIEFKVLKSAIEFSKCKKSSSLHNIDLENESSHEIDTNHKFIRSVTELREAGIKFEKTKCSSLLDVKFENGIIKIPPLLVDDNTEWLFRNLIAYEQYSGKTGKTYMTDYMNFMDCLLSSPKDVEILRHSGIIDNWLGDDKVVSTMFNKMGNHVVVCVNPKNFYYGKVFKEVNKYCKHRRHGWMAFLRYNYCNSPWSILSVIVATVFLLLTVIQTGCSILQV